MAKSSTFAVDTNDTAIIPTIRGKKIIVQEDPAVANWPTTDFKLKFPDASATAIRQPAGTAFVIQSETDFVPGRAIGYVSTVSGATDFTLYEQGL